MGKEFFGRGRDRRIAAAALRHRRSVLIRGARGVGKSAFALAVIADSELTADDIVVISSTATVREIPLGSLASLLPPVRSLGPISGLSVGWATTQVANRLDQRLLFVDDAQHLDPLSAAVLHEVAVAGAPVIVAVGDDPPEEDAVTALGDEPIGVSVVLGPLLEEATAALAAATIGAPLSPPDRRRLFRAADGVPRAVVETLRRLEDRGEIDVVGGTARIGGRLPVRIDIGDLVEDRVAELSTPATLGLLMVALSEPAGLADVEGAVGAACIDELEAAGLITIRLDGRRRFIQTSQALVSERALARATRRQRQAAIDALIGGPSQAGRRRTDMLRRAQLDLESGRRVEPSDLGRAARVAFDLGQIALADGRRPRLGENDLAERLARAAITAGGDFDASITLSEILAQRRENDESVTVLAAARPESPRELLVFTISRVLALALGERDFDAAFAAIDHAREQIEASVERVELEWLSCWLSAMTGDTRPALRAALPDPHTASPRLLAGAAASAGPPLIAAGRLGEAEVLLRAAIARNPEIDDRRGVPESGLTMLHEAHWAVEYGDIHAARDLAREGFDLATDHELPVALGWMALLLGLCEQLAGDLTQAHEWFQHGAEHLSSRTGDDSQRVCLAGLALVDALRRDAESATAHLRQVQVGPVGIVEPTIMRCRAWVVRAEGDIDACLMHLEAAFAHAEKYETVGFGLAAAHDLVRLGLAEDIERLLSVTAACEGPMAAARRRHIAGIADRDVDELRAVGEDFARLGVFLHAAEALSRAAELERRAGHQARSLRDRRRAIELLPNHAEIDTPSLRALSSAGAVESLTERELDVARLAAARLASKEIAARLDVSTRTVDNHLARVYRKLEIGSRHDLVELLAARPGDPTPS